MTKEPESYGNFVHDGELVPLTNANTRIYTHLGALAIYDHIFVTHNGGFYIWNTTPAFNDLLERAQEKHCIMYANLQEVNQHDKKLYIEEATRDLVQTSTIPVEWL